MYSKAPTNDGWKLRVVERSHRHFVHPTKPGKVTVAGRPSLEQTRTRRQKALYSSRPDCNEQMRYLHRFHANRIQRTCARPARMHRGWPDPGRNVTTVAGGNSIASSDDAGRRRPDPGTVGGGISGRCLEACRLRISIIFSISQPESDSPAPSMLI